MRQGVRAFAVGGLVVLATALGVVVNRVEASIGPFWPTAVSGTIGEDVEAYPFTVHVTEAAAARTVTATGMWDDGEPIGSDGVWVVVELSYATAEEIDIAGSYVRVRDAQGREYPVSSRSDAMPWTAGPDVWVRGQLGFEVAPDSLDGLELIFDPQQHVYGPMPFRYAVIPLELDPDSLAETIPIADDVVVLGEGER